MRSEASPHLSQLAERAWRFHCREVPLFAALAGEQTDDAVLFRESTEDHERRDLHAGELLAELDRIEAKDLSPEDRVTEAVLRHEFVGIRRLFSLDAHRRPSLFPNGPVMMLVHFANMTSIGDAESAARYVDRLASVPAYLEDLAQCLLEGRARGLRYPRPALACAIAQARGTLAVPIERQPWGRPFETSAVATRPGVQREAERARRVVAEQLVPAIERYTAFLESLQATASRETAGLSDDPAGRELYCALVRQFTTTDLSPDAIHDLGVAEVRRLSAEIEEIAATAGFPHALADYRRFLAGEAFVAATPDALREQIEALTRRIDGRIPAFFGRTPRITYTIEAMSAALSEHMPPAYAQPNPVDRRGPGIYWLTRLPHRLPSYLHVPVSLHEAWPGHLMHLALIQEAEHLPPVRRHAGTRYLAYIEGWALYCEGLGVEMGLYTTPHQHYGRLEGELWRAVRLVVDTGMHWCGWTRQQAIDYMASYLALDRRTIENEVDRYIAWPGQALVYQLGGLTMRRLRARAEQVLGDRFDHRAFHDIILAAGPMTLPALERFVDDWLAAQTSQGGPE